AEVAPLLSSFGKLLEGRAKAAVVTDVQAVEAALRARPSLDLTLVARAIAEEPAAKTTRSRARAAKAAKTPKTTPLRDDLVTDYRQKLESSLGDPERFAAVFNHLRSNTDVGKAEIAALSKQMTGSAGRSIDDGLKKIMNRHHTLMAFKAKSQATGG